MGSPPAGPSRPIGFWLRRADEAITKHADHALSRLGLTRLQWQVLHSLHESATTTERMLADTLRSFADPARLGDVLAGFETEGWLTRDATGTGTLALTEKGRAGHAAAFEVQGEVRRRAAQGISAEEYTTVLRVLERMVANLEPDRD